MSVMLDKRDTEILVFINRYRLKHNGTPPTLKEIGKALTFRSESSVYARLLKLHVAGYVDKEPKRGRSLIVTENGLEFMQAYKHKKE